MRDIDYVWGDATFPNGRGNKIILSISNSSGGWGRGFVLAISKRWKAPEAAYREWFKLKNESFAEFVLGAVRFVKVEPEIEVAIMLAQDGYSKPGKPAVNYIAVRECLKEVYQRAKKIGASIHGPKIGAGLSGGDWNIISEIIKKELCDKGIDVTIYELA